MAIRFATLLVLLSAGSFVFAGQIREGATMYVKANSMWFESASTLATWQRDRKHFTPGALKAHQDNLLGSREAWQFTTKQPVRIRRYWTTESEVEVEMLSPGRLHGSVWWVDDKDCVN
jgi:hypothetical protein